MARVLVCGTLAYDDIGFFDTPLDAASRNVKLERLHRGFGGCAMNVAYNLAGLGHVPVPFVYVGDDYAGEYARHVAAAGISEVGIFHLQGMPSARGIVLTGGDGAQFTAFYPGPSGLERWPRDLDDVLAGERFDGAVIAPDLPVKMAGCAERLGHVPLRVWCPGQYAELLDGDDVLPLVSWCNLLVANRHEWRALCGRLPSSELQARAGRVVITDGERPVETRPDGARVPVAPVAEGTLHDPTGCGDAFLAALVSALLRGHELSAAVAEGNRLAACCLISAGAQAHRVRADEDSRP